MVLRVVDKELIERTGGIVQGIDAIKQAYETGRGKIILKAKTEIIEEDGINKIIITEIPYDVNKAMLVKKMTDMVDQKNVDGIILLSVSISFLEIPVSYGVRGDSRKHIFWR